MTEATWLASDDPAAMLDALRGGTAVTPSGIPYYSSGVAVVSARKLRLFGEACCLAHGSRPEFAERVAAEKEDPAAWARAWADRVEGTASADVPQAVKAALLRDICGNPFGKPYLFVRPVYSASRQGYYHYKRDGSAVSIGEAGKHRYLDLAWLAWRDGTVPRLARRIHDERAFDLMPVLADALTDAGCQDEAVLRHCRGEEVCWGCRGDRGFQANSTWVPCEWCDPDNRGGVDSPWLPLRGPHARGCWVTDLLLGLE